MRTVVETAVAAEADAERFPKHWLFKKRWSKASKVKPTVEGRPIEFLTVGGRTSAYLPHLQVKGANSAAAGKGGGGPPKEVRSKKAGMAKASGGPATKLVEEEAPEPAPQPKKKGKRASAAEKELEVPSEAAGPSSSSRSKSGPLEGVITEETVTRTESAKRKGKRKV